MVAPPGNTTLANSLADVNVGLPDVVERRVVEFAGSCIRETWLEQHFDATGDSSRLLVPSSNQLGLRTSLVVKMSVVPNERIVPHLHHAQISSAGKQTQYVQMLLPMTWDREQLTNHALHDIVVHVVVNSTHNVDVP